MDLIAGNESNWRKQQQVYRRTYFAVKEKCLKPEEGKLPFCRVAGFQAFTSPARGWPKSKGAKNMHIAMHLP